MPFVERDAGGQIIASFANPQPGRAEEGLPDDSPEVIALDTRSGPYTIAKDLPWRRMSDDEAALVEALIAASPPRLRQIYNAANVIYSGDELFQTLEATLAGALGADRATELLAPAE